MEKTGVMGQCDVVVLRKNLGRVTQIDVGVERLIENAHANASATIPVAMPEFNLGQGFTLSKINCLCLFQ